MARQRVDHGIEWAIASFVVPAVGTIIAIQLIEAQYGEMWAGFAYIVLTVIVLGGIALSARFWHIPSTLGFLVSGFFLWSMIPDVTAELLPWPFRVLQSIIVVIFFAIIAMLLWNKF